MNHRKNQLIQTMLARRDWPSWDRTGLYVTKSPILPKTYISVRELNRYLRKIGRPKGNKDDKIYSYVCRLAVIKRYVEGLIDFSDLIVPLSTLYYLANNYAIDHFSNVRLIYRSFDRYSRNYLPKNTIHISNSTFHYSAIIEADDQEAKNLIQIKDCELEVFEYPDWFEGDKTKGTPIKSLDIFEIDTEFSDPVDVDNIFVYNARCFAFVNGIYIIDNHYVKISCLTTTIQDIEAQTFSKCHEVDKEKYIEIRKLFLEEVRKHVKY